MRSCLPAAYDALSSVLWLLEGAGALRERILDAASIDAGDDVLELGCGTGALTAAMLRRGARVTAVDRSPAMLRRGARVTAVDRSPAMLRRARERAPAAGFVEADVAAPPRTGFGRVLIAFVLHEMEPAARATTLRHARAALGEGGTVTVADFGMPDGWRGTLWRTLVARWEPPSVREVMERGLAAEAEAAGLRVRTERRLASGRVRLLVAG